MLRHAGVQIPPRFAHCRFVLQADQHPAHVAFVRQLARLRLQHDRVADAFRDAHGIVGAARQATSGHGQAGAGQPGLALVFGKDAVRWNRSRQR